MAVIVESVSNSTFGSTDPIVITKPTGLAVGDMMCAFLFVNATGGTNQDVTASGWSGGQQTSRTSTSPYSKTYFWYKVADSADVAASDFSFDVVNQALVQGAGVILRLSGMDTGTPVSANGGAVDQGASLSFTGLTPVFANSLLIFMAAGGQEAAAVTTTGYAIVTSNPSWTEKADINDGATVSLAVATATRPEVTATSTATATLTGAGGGTDTHGVLVAITPFQVDRYWVGGTGNWDASTTTHWAYTSGGAGGASVPTSANNVYFDANSGGGTVTVTATANCIDLVFTGATNTFAGSSALNVYGSMTLASTTTLTYTGAITYAAVAAGKTITMAGKTILGTITFNGAGGGWTLQDSVTSSSTITLTLGTLALGSSIITLSGTGALWTASGGTITPGTSTIKYTNASSSSKTFAGGSLEYGNIWFTGAGTGVFIISGSNTFIDFKVDTPPHTVNFTAGTTQTVQTFTVSGTAGNLMTLNSTSNGSAWYITKSTAGTVSCDYLSLRDSHAI